MHRALESLVDKLFEQDPESGKDLIRAYLMQELFQFLGRTQCLFETAILPIAKLPITTCMMTIAPTGGGKTRVNTTLNYIFGDYSKLFKAEIKKRKEAFNNEVDAQALVKFGDSDKKASKRDAWAKANYTMGFVSINDQIGTTQGVAHALNAMQDLKIGSYCHRFDECASLIVSNNQNTKDFLDALLQFTGGTTTLSRTLKGEVVELDATGIAFNVHFFGNTQHFEEDTKSLAVFRSFLRRGFSRRNFYTYIPNRIETKREWLDIVPDYEKLNKIASFFTKRFYELSNQENKTFTFSEEAKSFLKDYKIANQYPTGNVDADNEKIDHVFKAQKLACILAFLDNSFVIEKHHCQSSIYYVQKSAQAYLALLGHVQKSVQAKTDAYPLQIFENLLKNGAMTKIPLVRSLQPQAQGHSAEKWEGYISEASRFAEEEGFFLIKESTKNGRGTQYRLEPIQTTPEATVTYSVKAPDVPEEPKRCLGTGYELQTTTLEEMCLYGSFLHVSPAVFKGGHRKSENVEYLGNLAFFDVDNDVPSNAMLTIEDARLRLKGYQGAVIESMSSTIEQPRFRIVVVLDKLVKGISKETYKRVLNNIAKHLGIDGAIDKACVEPSRYYAQTCREAGEGVTYANLYGRPLAWEQFIEDNAVVSRPTVHAIAEVDVSEDEVKRRFSKAVKTAIKRHWRVGTRNNLAYYLVKLGREKGLLDSEIEALIAIESSGEGVPLDHKELKAVVTNAGRY